MVFVYLFWGGKGDVQELRELKELREGVKTTALLFVYLSCKAYGFNFLNFPICES